jgi:DNA-binding Lrp family transcriptional regulator
MAFISEIDGPLCSPCCGWRKTTDILRPRRPFRERLLRKAGVIFTYPREKETPHMAGSKLDPIDRHILAELQADGRMTNVELAKRVGISAPPCLRRVRTLEEAGYIRGYHADIDARELGFEVQVFAMVRLQSQAEVDLSAFEARAKAWPLVRECHMLNGEIDFILKCVAPDLSTFQRFLTAELTSADNVASVKTSLVIRCAKDEPGLPFDVLEERLKKTA